MTDLTMKEMEEKVIDRVIELVDKFNTKFGSICEYDVQLPQDILFDLTGLYCGRWSYNSSEMTGKMHFNPKVMEANWAEFDQTVVHEVAHLCCFYMHGVIRSRAGRVMHHGTHWKRIMEWFGKPAKTHSNYKIKDTTTKKRQRRWEYSCGCQTHMITTTRHNKIKRGEEYFCIDCNNKIKYVGK